MTDTGSASQRPVGDLDREAKLPLIAVIAVHGVADQAPNESARQVAELLLRQRYDGDTATYTSFREYPLRIPVDPPLPLCKPHECALATTDTLGSDGSASAVDLDLTHRLLHEYRSSRTPYDTVRLEGHRLRQPQKGGEQTDWIARDQCHVHVYELFWADLSRLGTGLVGFVGAIYQLVSSLAQLGMRTIRQARRQRDPADKSAKWTRYIEPHRFAVWLLTIVVPFLNLGILGAALTMLVARIPTNTQAGIFALTVVLLALSVRTFLRLRATAARGTSVPLPTNSVQQGPKGPSIVWLVLLGAFGVLIYWSLTRKAVPHLVMQLAVSQWVLLLAAALIYLGHIYESRIRTAFRMALALSVPTAVALFAYVWTADDIVELSQGAVRTVEVLFLGLTLSWILLTVAGILSALAGLSVVNSVVHEKERAKRAAWTAASTLAVSTASLSALTLFVWSAFYAVLAQSLPAPEPASVAALFAEGADPSQQTATRMTADTSWAYTPLAPHVVLASRRPEVCFDPAASASGTRVVQCNRFSLKTMLRTLLSVSAMSGLLVNGFAMLLAGAIGLWLALPSVLQEIRPASRASAQRSKALGAWLTQGFVQLRKAAVVVYALIFGGTGIVIGLALWLAASRDRAPGIAISLFEILQPRSDAFLFGIGSVVAASTVGLVALLTRFEGWAKVVRPALDVALDVDNYLKSRPVRRTPRARMMERFVALLRYVTRWRRDGSGYDAVIIVAHSQGTVLATELLRYQTERGFTNLSLEKGYPWPNTKVGKPTELGVDVFTMGSPLRQLYASSFPDLFSWTQLAEPCGADSRRALCKTLGVRRWWNVYRSGDYVGRALWQYGGMPEAYEPDVWSDKGDSCREKCLGPGAHTHYWDEHGTDVGKVLDEMIRLAHEASPRK